MNLSNYNEEFKIRSLKLTITIIATIPISIAIFSDVFQDYIYPLHKAVYSLFFVMIYAGFMVYISLLKHYYIHFSDEGDKLTFRFYRMRIIGKKYKAYEIPKKLFKGFESKFSFKGKVEEIILLQKTKTGIFRYPAISISALNKQDAVKIKDIMNKIAIQNR
jgi:hypothetical protein